MEKVQISGESAICSDSRSVWRSTNLGNPSVFQGASSLSLDAKGRLSVPTRHRDVLAATASSQLTITKHPHGCLMVFPAPSGRSSASAWRSFPCPPSGGNASFGQRHGCGHGWNGPCVISPELRAAAGLTKEAVLLGMGNHFELWDKATYDEQEAQAMQGEMPDAFKDFFFLRPR